MSRIYQTLSVLLMFVFLTVSQPDPSTIAENRNFEQKQAIAQGNSSAYTIHLLTGEVEPKPGQVGDSVSAKSVQESRLALVKRGLDARQAGLDKIHALLQFEELPTQKEIEKMQRDGIELLEYIPQNTWMAAIPADNPIQTLAAPGVRWLGDWNLQAKMHPALAAEVYDSYLLHPTTDHVMTMVLLHKDVPLERGRVLAEKHGGEALPPVEGVHGMTVWLPRANLEDLAGEEEIAWIEPGPAPLSTLNDGVRSSMQINPLYGAPYNLGGAGVRLFIFDGGAVRATHTNFTAGAGSRVILLDSSPVDDHPTHVAGSAAGDGNGGRAQGIAPLATILSAGYEQKYGSVLFWDNAGDMQADYALARKNYGADLVNNSIGSNIASNNFDCALEGNYGVTSSLVDGIVRGDNQAVGSAMIAIFANGNERTGGTFQSLAGRCGSNYATTPPPACAKNPIHVGAINSDFDTMTSFSSWGPCDDGRLKPVVVASGCEFGRVSKEYSIYSSFATDDSAFEGACGTSMAAPAASGVVALMIEQWRNLGYGGVNDRPLPALVKALLIHTARDLGQAGPDYIYGFGEIDAQAVIDFMRAGAPLPAVTEGAQRWGASTVSHLGIQSYVVALPAGTAELKASLAWDDWAAAAYASVALVNDLDLELVAPDGVTIYRPWTLNPAAPYQAAVANVNTRDNQEQVVVKNPAAGFWTVRVRGANVPYGPQTFGLAISARMPSYHQASCSQAIGNGSFEMDTSGWTVSGASRVSAPASGHGNYSLRLGGVVDSIHSAYTTVAIPAGMRRAELSYFWFMTTNEGPAHPYDRFYVELRSNSSPEIILAVVDFRTDGWYPGQWMKAENIDLTPWAGQTIRLYFYASNDNLNTTSFYVDDINLELCGASPQSWWVGSSMSTSTPANWSNGVLPSCALDTIIPYPPLGKSAPMMDWNMAVRNFTVQSGAQFVMSSYVLGVCGNWNLESGAIFTANAGEVQFNGASLQTIGGGQASVFPALMINNSGGGVTMQQPVVVNHLLTLSNGVLRLGNHHLTLQPMVAVAGTPSVSRMIVTDGSGEMRKVLAQFARFTFPVGEETGVAEYSPLTLSFFGGSITPGAIVGVRVVDAKHPSNLAGNDFLTRYWSVTQTGITNPLVNFQFWYHDADIAGNEANVAGVTFRSPAWWMIAPVNGSANTVSGLSTSLGDLTGMPASATALLTAGAHAESQAGRVRLVWNTSVESTIASFNIYRSDTPGGSKSKLNGAVIPALYASQAKSASYEFFDTSGAIGVTYYYWIEVNLNGGGTAWFGPYAGYAGLPVFFPLITAP
jgi:hypothetical protein